MCTGPSFHMQSRGDTRCGRFPAESVEKAQTNIAGCSAQRLAGSDDQMRRACGNLCHQSGHKMSQLQRVAFNDLGQYVLGIHHRCRACVPPSVV